MFPSLGLARHCLHLDICEDLTGHPSMPGFIFLFDFLFNHMMTGMFSNRMDALTWAV